MLLKCEHGFWPFSTSVPPVFKRASQHIEGNNMKALLSKVALGALIACAGVGANAQAVLTNGAVSIGVQQLGALGGGGVGISFSGVGDGITPGCLCEGWGASANGVAGWSANDNGGNANVSLASFSSTATTATSVVNVGGAAGLQVSQAYSPSSSSALFQNRVTLTNTTGAAISDVRYSRSMDWDIPPTTFREDVTIQGVGATNLIFSNDNGFATPNPLANPGALMGGTTNVNFTDVGAGDHGAFFTFAFGSLAAGASIAFDIFYGAAPTETDALAALGTVGAEVYSFGQNSTTAETTGAPATYIFAFAGVGGTPVSGPVPEPETYAMMGMGLLGMAAAARRRRNKQA
jgi:hypothetical protein